MNDSDSPIPPGFCQCGCGEKTAVAKKTQSSSNRIKGQPVRFIAGHQWRKQREALASPNPSGLCQCGCGEIVPPARKTNTKEQRVKGRPGRYLPGHRSRAPRVVYEPADGPNPSGLCVCGCGGRTQLAKKTNARDETVKGQPRKYLKGHHTRLSSVDYLVNKFTDCWEWQRGMRPDGYGAAFADGRNMSAHRMVYQRLKGPIPEGLQLDHLCRNRRCVNPDHLEPVTQAENVRRGKVAKLNREQVLAIRDAVAGGAARKTLAIQYGVTEQLILKIVHRELWRDI